MISIVRFSLAALAALGVLSGPAHGADDVLDRQAVRDIVRDYLLEQPEVVDEALQVLQRRRAEVHAEQARAAVSANRAALVAHPLSPVSGNSDGDVTLVEFYDYQCGYCKRVSGEVMKVLESDPDLRIVWKEYPVLGPTSVFAARASMAADLQGRFLDFHKALMQVEGTLDESVVLAVADRLGLDRARLETDMDRESVGAYIAETRDLAQRLGISGTPAFVIGDQLVPGAIPVDEIRRVIAVAREGTDA